MDDTQIYKLFYIGTTKRGDPWNLKKKKKKEQNSMII